MTTPLADIVIVTWNGREDTLRALESVFKQTGSGMSAVGNCSVTVVDNASTDGTADEIRRRFPTARIIRLATNRGFTGGIRAGVEASDARHVVFLNNDAVPEEGWLSAFIDSMESAPADVSSIAGKIIDPTGQFVDFIGGMMTFDGHAFQRDFRRALALANEPAHGAELFFACGGNMIVRRERYLALGGFDDDYFAYLEDVDFGWRSWIAGNRVTYDPRAVVRHKSSATSDRLGAFERGVLFERNAIQTAIKNFERSMLQQMSGPIFLTLLHRLHRYVVDRNEGTAALTRAPFEGVRASAPQRSLRGRVRRKLGGDDPRLTDPLTTMQFRAMHWLFANTDRVMEKRQAVQQLRQRPDSEIFSRFPMYVVPTYHGDGDLFSSPLFRAMLPELEMRFASLEEIIKI